MIKQLHFILNYASYFTFEILGLMEFKRTSPKTILDELVLSKIFVTIF